MSSWMRRSCSALALVCLAPLAACEGPAAELNVTLERAPSATLDGVTTLRFIVRELSAEAPEVFGPVEIDRTRPMRLSAQVTPGSEFYVDVWGCESAPRCVPEAVLARGCTPILVVEGDTAVDITMYDVGAPELALCPPEPAT